MAGKTDRNIRMSIWLNDKTGGKTLRELRSEAKKLRNEIAGLRPGTQAFIDKTKQLRLVDARIQKINKELRAQQSWWQRLTNASNKYFNLIAGVSVTIAGLLLGFNKIQTTINDFEKTLTNVFTLLSDEDLQKYGNFIEEGSVEIIKKYGFAIQDTNKALFDAISAGVGAADSIDYMDEAARLAIGGVTELATANDGLTSVMNAYHLEIDETSTVADAFFSAQKEGKTTVGELAAGIGKVAPIASKLKISYQELLSQTAALTKGGISTDEAFTYLRGTLVNLIKPSDDLSKMFTSEFGHGLGVTEVNARGVNTVMEELNYLMEKYPDELAAAVPNVRALTATMALSGEGLDEYQKILEQVNTDIGENSSLSKAMAIQQETTAFRLQQAKGEWKATTLELRDFLKPVLTKIYSIYSKFGHLMIKFIGFLKENWNWIKAIIKVLTVLISYMLSYKIVLLAINNLHKIGTLAMKLYRTTILLTSAAYNFMTGNITRATAAMRVLNITMKSNPIGLIIGLLSAAATALILFKNKVKDAKEEQDGFNKELEDTLSFTDKLVKQLVNLNVNADKIVGTLPKLNLRQLEAVKTALEALKEEQQDVMALNEMTGKNWTVIEAASIRLDEINEALKKVNAKIIEVTPKEKDEITGAGDYANELDKEKKDKALAPPDTYEDDWLAWLETVLGSVEAAQDAWTDYLINRENEEENYLEYAERVQNELIEAYKTAAEEWVSEDMIIMEVGEEAYTQYLLNRKDEDENYFEWLKRKREEDAALEKELLTKSFDDAKKTTDALVNLVNAAKENELSKLREVNQYKGESDEAYQIRVEQLERKKNEIAKKYADVQFLMTGSKIVADTAAAVVKALAELGPIAGPIAATAMGITGALQLSIANQERQKVKGYYFGGDTGLGIGIKDPYGRNVAGYVHENEYVIPEFIRSHPVVAQLEPIIENIRKQNLGGYYEGGNVQSTGVKISNSENEMKQFLLMLITKLDHLEAKINWKQADTLQLRDEIDLMNRVDEEGEM